MKITDVKIYHMRGGVRRNWTFVKMETDQGLYGWGEGTLEGLEHAVEQAIHALANRYLIGQDPTNIERHWQVMYRHGFWRGGPVLGSAVAALDQALWDVTGKAYGEYPCINCWVARYVTESVFIPMPTHSKR